MNIGRNIHYFRNKNGMTQTELAHGICSKSYLSKIENNVTIPNKEIIELLFKKLDLSLATINTPLGLDKLYAKLKEWYEIIKSRDIKRAEIAKEEFSQLFNNIKNPTILIQYQLFTLRFYLLVKDFQNAYKTITELKLVEQDFKKEQIYYFYYFLGLYEYLAGNLLIALKSYSTAEKLDKELNIHEPEIYYLLSLCHIRLHHITLAIYYSNITLENSNKNMDYLRSIETQIILAINYIRINNFELAELYLIKSLNIATNINNKPLISTIKHNLGYLNSRINNHNKAINYYLESLADKSSNTVEFTNTILYLAKEYVSIGNQKEALDWILKGFKISKKNNFEIPLTKFKALYYQLKNNSEKYQKHLENIVIPYFNKMEDWNETSKYAESLADYYSQETKYKKASHYYWMANESRKKLQSEVTK